jgi:hypothetical protein
MGKYRQYNHEIDHGSNVNMSEAERYAAMRDGGYLRKKYKKHPRKETFPQPTWDNLYTKSELIYIKNQCKSV